MLRVRRKFFGVFFFFFFFSAALAPQHGAGPYATARRMTKTPGIPELQPQ